MSATALALIPEKQCGQCRLVLPLGEFGIAKHRPDGRNYYCKACVRNQVYAGRERKKEMRSAIFWIGIARTRYVEMIEWLEEPMICSDCMEWFSVKSRTPKVCRDCESKAIARAAKEIDSTAYSIAELASWVMTKTAPHRIKRAWVIQ